MVIYYSSTGNSRHVALRLQETFKGDLIDVCTFNKSPQFYLEDDETLFLVTFNCFWGISNFMETFIRKRIKRMKQNSLVENAEHEGKRLPLFCYYSDLPPD
ncbi:MAG: hypothetical protein AB7V48_16655 [Sedimentibacter sp.]